MKKRWAGDSMARISPLRSAGYDEKAAFYGAPFVLGIDFNVAKEFFGDDFFFAVERLQIRSEPKADLGYHTG